MNTYGLRQLKRTPAMPDTIGECERKRRLLVFLLNIPFSLFKCLNSNCSKRIGSLAEDKGDLRRQLLSVGRELCSCYVCCESDERGEREIEKDMRRV